MKYIFTLFDKKNNITIDYHENFDWEDENLMLFQWLQNNYSCDCNRRLFIDIANNIKEEDIPEYNCGSEVKILKILREDRYKTEVNFKTHI